MFYSFQVFAWNQPLYLLSLCWLSPDMVSTQPESLEPLVAFDHNASEETIVSREKQFKDFEQVDVEKLLLILKQKWVFYKNTFDAMVSAKRTYESCMRNRSNLARTPAVVCAWERSVVIFCRKS